MTTRVILRRSPDPDRRASYSQADHLNGACPTGCPWCTLPPSDPDLVVIVDEPEPPEPAPKG